jgi:hypothetical protein
MLALHNLILHKSSRLTDLKSSTTWKSGVTIQSDSANTECEIDAAWWSAKTKGMNFSAEDLNDPEAFNRIIWRQQQAVNENAASEAGG